jgi:hypothetical protein
MDYDDELWVPFVRDLRAAWLTRDAACIKRALGAFEPYGPLLRETLDGLEWLEARLGVRLSDIKAENLGIGSSGRMGMRDLGRCAVPAELLAGLKSLVELAVPATKPGPT